MAEHKLPFRRRKSLLDRVLGAAGAYTPIPQTDGEDDLPDHFFRINSKGQSQDDAEGGFVPLVDGMAFQSTVALLIICNAVVVGLETDLPHWKHWELIEHFFLMLFTAELLLRIGILGAPVFFSCGKDITWNVLDFAVVSLGLLDVLIKVVAGDQTRRSGTVATVFRTLRLLRILRIFRIIRYLKQLYLLAYGLAAAAQAVFWVSILMMFVLYVCSILLVRSVGRIGEADPHGMFLEARFGNIPLSMFSLFELMSSTNLPEYANQDGLLAAHPQLTAFLIVFVIFGSFGMIALLTGVISESMLEKNQMRIEEERSERENLREWLQERCRAIFRKLSINAEGDVSIGDVSRVLPIVQRLFDAEQVDYMKEELYSIAPLMDKDGNGSISEQEFCHALLTLATGLRSISVLELYHTLSVVHGKVTLVQGEVARLLGEGMAEPFEELRKKVDELLEEQKKFTAVGDLVRESVHQIIEQVTAAVPGAIAAVAGQLSVGARPAAPMEHTSHSMHSLPPGPVAEDLEPQAKVVELQACPRDTAGDRESSSVVAQATMSQGAAPAGHTDFQQLLEEVEVEFHSKLHQIMRSHSESLAKVVALEAKVMLLGVSTCLTGGPAVQPPAPVGMLLCEPITSCGRQGRYEDRPQGQPGSSPYQAPPLRGVHSPPLGNLIDLGEDPRPGSVGVGAALSRNEFSSWPAGIEVTGLPCCEARSAPSRASGPR